MSKKLLLFFIIIYFAMTIVQGLQIVASSDRFVETLNLIVVIVVSLIVGGFIREWFLLRDKEREARPVYRHSADPGEIDQAEQLLYTEIYEPWGLDKSARDELRAEGEDRYFVTKLDGRIVAAMILTVNGASAVVHHAAVAKAYRGREIGLTLWQVVHEYAKRQGIRRILVYSSNTSFGFWRRCGLEDASEDWIEHEAFVPHNIRYKKMQVEVSAG